MDYKNESDTVKVAPTQSNGVMHQEVAGVGQGKAWSTREPYGSAGELPNSQQHQVS
jgi:hypothetical protein